MLNEIEIKERDNIRKKYYHLEKTLYFISFRKIVISLGITWSAWYKFVYYGENCISLETLMLLERKMKEELLKVRAEIDNILHEIS